MNPGQTSSHDSGCVGVSAEVDGLLARSRDNSSRSADTRLPPLGCPRHIQWKKCPVPPARRASMTKLFQNAEVRLQTVAGDKMHWRFGKRRRGLWPVHPLSAGWQPASSKCRTPFVTGDADG